jgi:L-threonylcarbamoyladenylate synthase
LKTELLAATPDAIERAVDLLERGEVVALPTETVYGLAADATNPTAAAKIFEAKERPFFDPLIVHLPDKSWLDRVTQIPNGDALLVGKLIGKFWPGPLTLVLPRREIVPEIVTGGLQTVAVRMSSHAVLRAVLEKFGKPVAAPSANRFGRISPTAAEHVRAELDGKIPLILDGGATQHGIESTIVAVGKNVMRILRAGPITHEELAPFCEVIETGHGEKPQAPGQLESHYAPRTPMRLIKNSAAFKPASAERCGLIAFNQRRHAPAFSKVEILSATGDLREAAANFFAAMRRLDEAGLDLIVAEEIPETGLGRAIMDRLRKAAAQKGNC